MMHDEGFRSPLDQVALGGMRCDDVANGIGHATFECQRDSGKGMAQGFATLRLPALAVGTEFVLQQLADVRQNRACDNRVDVNLATRVP